MSFHKKVDFVPEECYKPQQPKRYNSDNWQWLIPCFNQVILSLPSVSHDILFLSIAMSTTECQFDQMATFFHADERQCY